MSLPEGLTDEDLDVVAMGFKRYQQLQQKYLVYPQPHNNLAYPIFGVVGELGEFVQKLKKNQRDGDGLITPKLIGELEEELGDIVWYLQAICGELNTSLEECAVRNLKKIFGRKERGTIHGDGDDR